MGGQYRWMDKCIVRNRGLDGWMDGNVGEWMSW